MSLCAQSRLKRYFTTRSSPHSLVVLVLVLLISACVQSQQQQQNAGPPESSPSSSGTVSDHEANDKDNDADTSQSRIPFDPDGVPKVPEGFEASILAGEPAFIHPGALAFDRHGRLFVGGGPQFRDPGKETPPDSIWIVTDRNQDGKAENVKKFATGFNSIQGLAFHDGDLWVANAPDVTIVRDHNNDDQADEFVKVFTNLGHLRHGLHGFVWGPDGRLYMSQGNSRVQKGAPEAWRKLMHVESDQPDRQPVNKVYEPDEYEADYIDHWPSEEGGFLRCRDMGKDLEIFARGNRNPWDWAYGPGFNWLATDNDPGPDHDRVIMPFEGAHFGMKHPWSYSWTGNNSPATVPLSSLFEHERGSGVGVVYYQHRHFPETYRDLFYIGDWTNNTVYEFRPKWDGALMKDRGTLDIFVNGGTHGGGELNFAGAKDKPLFRPTDLAVGPGGALYVASWGPHYGSKHAPYRDGDKNARKNWGRVFRIRHSKRSLTDRDDWLSEKRKKPYEKWSVDQLIADLGKQLPVWRTNAQEELVRRGSSVTKALKTTIRSEDLNKMGETWAVWTLGRIGPDPELFRAWASGKKAPSFNVQRQAIRILGDRDVDAAAETVAGLLDHEKPRIRFSATQALRKMGARDQAEKIAAQAQHETRRLCYYTQWKALRALWSTKKLKTILQEDDRENVRRAALLALLEDNNLNYAEVGAIKNRETSSRVREIAKLWMKKTSMPARLRLTIKPDKRLFRGTLKVQIERQKTSDELTLRHTTDGRTPKATDPEYDGPISISRTATVKAAFFKEGTQVGTVHSASYDKITDRRWKNDLFVHDVKSNADGTYEVGRHGLKSGASLYTDMAESYKEIPDLLKGATYIRTASVDREIENSAIFQIRVNQPVIAYVAYQQGHKPPSWLTSGFKKTGLTITSTDEDFSLYRKNFDAGLIRFGGNGGGKKMYQVILVQNTGQDSGRTGVQEAMRNLSDASAQRGRKLYFGKGGCMTCHRLEGEGQQVGPDLDGIGGRENLRYIVSSILNPSAEIIEGYHQESIKLKNGDQYFGMVRGETGKTLTLFTMGGRRERTFAKDQITSREKMERSAMPQSFPLVLNAREVADLAKYLKQKKGD